MKNAAVDVPGLLARWITLSLALIAVIAVPPGFSQTAAPTPTASASPASPGRFTTFTMDTEPMDGYTLWLPPGWKPGGSWPLILSLHSAAEVGGAIEMASTTGAAGAIKDGGDPCVTAVGDRFIVLAPHLRQADYAKAQWYLYPGIIKALLSDAVKTWGADPRRIYAIGYSTGGAGVWGLLSRMPEVFAAVVPICGYTQPVKGMETIVRDFSACADTPIWAIYNVWDQNIPIQHIKIAVEKIENESRPPFLRLRHKMTSEGGGADHMIIAEASESLVGVPRIYSTFQVYFHDHAGSFFHLQLYDWMLSHVNPRKAKKVLKALSR